MEKSVYQLFENYMSTCMKDSAHDTQHVYRVLYYALDIAQTEENVDRDVLICACLLHDIGRMEQFENPAICHAKAGAEKAYHFLMENHFGETFAQKVAECIRSHRYRSDDPPQSIEAKILFDADKIDATGNTGIARTLIYKGRVSEPLYSVLEDGVVSNGENDASPSFFQEYQYKLKNVYTHFYTDKGARIAAKRQQAAVDFYNRIFDEVSSSYAKGTKLLKEYLV